jgi:alpha-L-fucosidase
MFDSSYTDYKITNTPYGKDVVRQLTDACQGRGMPLGFYYSPPDMHHTAFRDTTKLAKENWNGEPTRPEWPMYLEYMQLQLTELLTKYGSVALIWFDGLNHQEKYDGNRFLSADPETAACHFGERSNWCSGRLSNPGTVHP